MKGNFFYFWIGSLIFSVAFYLFLRFSSNVKLKRRIFPVVILITTGGFIAFVWSAMGDAGAFIYVVTAFSIAIAISNLRSTVFCDACGAATYSGRPFTKPTECSECGSNWI